MRTRCPNCGTTISLDTLIAHEAAREALSAVFKLSGSLGGAVVRYLGMFRPPQRELTMDRLARLLGELLPDLQAQRITRSGQQYDAPAEAWIWAVEQALAARDAGRLMLPLKSHGWLYEVISNWRPAGNDLRLADAVSGEPRRASSRTMSAIAALESRARD
ncbi:hypothetical protein [Burkholderia stagnalis]|nr:hypothetical protein [Burkholderia stagnalis]PAK14347.1 hypothetical protein CJO66_13490 [Burkholderia ubonensis]RQQ00378.1 hypothetical protein DF009_02020 [Burkholderia ubonensis]RQQ49254.1 hypothetical protein DF145_16210 [Burkholderia stagnalis]RQY00129.1 hypothetical protein DF121_16255 [Burkholderia stagnalis]RQY14633.1 hypothetical protein DF115_19305 [Burkholderia stagnalis]